MAITELPVRSFKAPMASLMSSMVVMVVVLCDAFVLIEAFVVFPVLWRTEREVPGPRARYQKIWRAI
jgi:hypothetical protein